MKQITMREFQLNAAKYLKELPIELTRYGEVVAVVNPTNSGAGVTVVDVAYHEVKKSLPKIEKERLQPDPAPLGMVKKEVVYVEPKKVRFTEITVAGTKFRVCPHRNESGQCPRGCVEEAK